MKELNPKAHKLNEEILKEIEANGAESERLPQMLMDLREFFLENEDPTVTKVLRLTAEHLTENGTFEINILSDVEVVEASEDEEVEEEAGELLEDYSAEDNIKYLLTLCMDAQNKYNREELFEVRDQLINW